MRIVSGATRSRIATWLKVLPPEFAVEPDRLARFTREAQGLASFIPHVRQ